MSDGRAVPDGLSSPTEPVSRLGPSGFDPSRERPSRHGEILGEALSDMAKAGAVGTDLLSAMCKTCAFREGCMTNKMASTGIVALNIALGLDPDDFACHYGMKNGQPVRLCAGAIAALRAPFEVKKAALFTMKQRLDASTGDDEVRADFDAWIANADPLGQMDDYERARAYAIAMEARRGETPQSGSTAEGGDSAAPKGIAQ